MELRSSRLVVFSYNMTGIEAMTGSGKIDLAKGQAHAESISAMLMAFPHLFPLTTNTWTANAPRNPATDTFTDPSLWNTYAFFYKEAQAATKYAFNASRAENETVFKKNAADLRLTCDTCHATFPKNN